MCILICSKCCLTCFLGNGLPLLCFHCIGSYVLAYDNLLPYFAHEHWLVLTSCEHKTKCMKMLVSVKFPLSFHSIPSGTFDDFEVQYINIFLTASLAYYTINVLVFDIHSQL